jgi:glycosyltransferase involved in cell wall biosynthesis
MMVAMKKKVCFFTTVSEKNIAFENYTIQDIQILKELGYEVVFANKFLNIPINCDLYFTWWASGSVIPLIKSLLFKIPMICVAGGNEVMIHRDSISNKSYGYIEYPFYKKLAVRLVLKFSKQIIVVSNFMLKDLVLKYAYNPVVIHNCVNNNIFKPVFKKSDYVLSIFKLDEHVINLKRGYTYLYAIAEVIKKIPDQRFFIIGRKGNGYENFVKLIKKLNITNNVIILGEIENSQINKWVQNAQLYVQLSDTETFGLAIAEAMSCATPVLVSSCGAIPEIVGSSGIYVDHNSVPSVSLAIINFLEKNLDEKIQIGKNLSKRISDNFSYERRKSELNNLITQII